MKAEEIKKLRTKKLHYSQKELAAILGVDKDTIYRWERKEQRPRPVHIRQLERLRKGNDARNDTAEESLS